MCSFLWLGNENIFVPVFCVVDGTVEFGEKDPLGEGTLSAAKTSVLAGSKRVDVRINLNSADFIIYFE